MSFLLKPLDKEPVAPGEAASGPEASFEEALSAAWTDTRARNISVSRANIYGEVWSEVKAAVEDEAGEPYDKVIAPFRVATHLPAGPGVVRDENEHRALAAYRDSLPEDRRGKILSREMMDFRAKEIVLDRFLHAEDVGRRTTGTLASVGGFAGEMGGAMSDPFNIASMALGAPAAASLLRIAIIEAAIGAGAEAFQQPSVQAWNKDVGLPSGFWNAVENVGMAGIGAGVLSPAAALLVRGLSKLTKKQLLDVHAKTAGADKNLAERQIVEQDDALKFSELGPEHQARLLDAERKITNFDIPKTGPTLQEQSFSQANPVSAMGIKTIPDAEVIAQRQSYIDQLRARLEEAERAVAEVETPPVNQLMAREDGVPPISQANPAPRSGVDPVVVQRLGPQEAEVASVAASQQTLPVRPTKKPSKDQLKRAERARYEIPRLRDQLARAELSIQRFGPQPAEVTPMSVSQQVLPTRPDSQRRPGPRALQAARDMGAATPGAGGVARAAAPAPEQAARASAQSITVDRVVQEESWKYDQPGSAGATEETKALEASFRARAQTEDISILIGEALDDQGQKVPVFQSKEDFIKEMDDDAKFIGELSSCVSGTGR